MNVDIKKLLRACRRFGKNDMFLTEKELTPERRSRVKETLHEMPTDENKMIKYKRLFDGRYCLFKSFGTIKFMLLDDGEIACVQWGESMLKDLCNEDRLLDVWYIPRIIVENGIIEGV